MWCEFCPIVKSEEYTNKRLIVLDDFLPIEKDVSKNVLQLDGTQSGLPDAIYRILYHNLELLKILIILQSYQM